MKKFVASLVLVLALCAVRTYAILVDWNALDFVFGSGANRSAIVIDWNDGGSPDYLSWGFYWDTPPGAGFVADLIQAVTNADPRLSFYFTAFPFGLFVDGIGFDSNTDNDFTDPGDHYQHRGTGWDPTFVFWEGNANDSAWSLAGSGISDTPVANERVFGFVWNNTGSWPGNPPPVVPEPATVLLAASGVAIVMVRRLSRPSA